MPTYEDCLKLIIVVILFCFLLIGTGKCTSHFENIKTNSYSNSTESSGNTFFFGFVLGSGN